MEIYDVEKVMREREAEAKKVAHLFQKRTVYKPFLGILSEINYMLQWNRNPELENLSTQANMVFIDTTNEAEIKAASQLLSQLKREYKCRIEQTVLGNGRTVAVITHPVQVAN